MSVSDQKVKEISQEIFNAVYEAVVYAHLRGVTLGEAMRTLKILGDVSEAKTDAMIVRKNYKGAGLYIKGLNYAKG